MSLYEASAWVEGLPDGWPGAVLGIAIIGGGLVGLFVLIGLGIAALVLPREVFAPPCRCPHCGEEAGPWD